MAVWVHCRGGGVHGVGVHGKGHAWQGVCMVGGHAISIGYHHSRLSSFGTSNFFRTN